MAKLDFEMYMETTFGDVGMSRFVANRGRAIILIYFIIVILINLGGLLPGFTIRGGGPREIATASAHGLMSVYLDDPRMRRISALGSVSAKNKQNSAIVSDYQFNWGTIMFGGSDAAAGGKLILNNYSHDGTVIAKSQLDFRLSSVEGDGSKSKFLMQGPVVVDGKNGHIQIEFVANKETFVVESLKGQVNFDGKVTDL